MINSVVDNKDLNLGNNLALKDLTYVSNPSDTTFSTLVNNVSSKVENTKTNFVDKAAKSNTSSVNQKALNAANANQTKEPSSFKKDKTKNPTNSDKFEQNSKNVSKKQKDNSSNKVKQEDNASKKEKSVEEKAFEDNVSNPQAELNQATSSKANSTSSKQSSKKDVSNSTNSNKEGEIENTDFQDPSKSPLVEPSPDFSQKTTLDDTNTSAKDISENDHLMSSLIASFATGKEAGVIDENLNSSELDDISISSQDFADFNSASVQKIFEIIESQNLNGEFKEDLNSSLNDFKNLQTSLKALNNGSLGSLENSFSSELENVKNSLNDISKALEENKIIKENILNSLGEVENSINSPEFKDILFQIKDFVQNGIDKEANSDDGFATLTSKINSFLDSLKDFSNNDENLSTIKTALEGIKNSFEINEDNLKTSLADLKESLKNAFDVLNSSKKETIKNDISASKSALEDIFKDVNLEELQKLSESQKEAYKKLLEAFDKNDDVDLNSLQKDLKEFLAAFEEQNGALDEIDLNSLKDSISKLASDLEKLNKNDILNVPKNNEIAFKSNLETGSKTDFQTDIDLNGDNSKVDLAENSLDIDEFLKNKDLNSSDFSDGQNENEFDFLNNSNVQTAKNSKNSSSIDAFSKIAKFSNNSSDKNLNSIEGSEATPNDILEDLMVDEMMSDDAFGDSSFTLTVQDEVAKFAIDGVSSSNSINQTNLDSSSISSLSFRGQNVKLGNFQNATQQAQMTQKMDESEVLSQITNKIAQTKDGSQKLTMILRPNDLGRLSIELVSGKDGLSTNILAQNEDVRNYIEKNIDGLRKQLAESGVNVSNIQIKTAGQEGSTNYQGNQDFQNETNQENGSFKDQNQGQNNPQERENSQNQTNRDFESSRFGYDIHQKRDFSSILMNKALSYLN